MSLLQLFLVQFDEWQLAGKRSQLLQQKEMSCFAQLGSASMVTFPRSTLYG